MSEPKKVWWRNTYAAAVTASDLPSAARLVALAYADHAHEGRTAWVTFARLMAWTHLSRDTINRTLDLLVALHWLRPVGWRLPSGKVTTTPTPRRPVVYEITAGSPVTGLRGGTTIGPRGEAGSPIVRTPVVRPSDSTSVQTSEDQPPGARARAPAREPHPHEANVRDALADARLPITDAQVLALAYELDPDPWEGYKRIKAAASTDWPEDAHSPLGFLRKRLRLGRTRRHPPEEGEHDARAAR